MAPAAGRDTAPAGGRQPRSDARRNVDRLLGAATTVFARSGVDAPAREIAAEAQVGVGTLYRHFPKRSDLVAAVFRTEVDACAAAADRLTREFAEDPDQALVAWLYRYTDFILTKHGLAAALHSGDPAFAELPRYFDTHLEPVLDRLLRDAERAGRIHSDLRPHTILHAVRSLCLPDDDGSVDHTRPVIDLLVDGLRYKVGPRAG